MTDRAMDVPLVLEALAALNARDEDTAVDYWQVGIWVRDNRPIRTYEYVGFVAKYRLDQAAREGLAAVIPGRGPRSRINPGAPRITRYWLPTEDQARP